MSTQFDPIEGKYEIPNPELMKSSYLPATLHTCRFWGGNERGVSFQLTIETIEGYSHIQLDSESTSKLIEILKKWKEE